MGWHTWNNIKSLNFTYKNHIHLLFSLLLKCCTSYNVSLFICILCNSRKNQGTVRTVSLSCWLPVFVSPKETIYAPYPSLLCTHLLHFQSILPHCLLSLSILTINYSAQPLPPTEAMSPPPLEMNDWQVCSVSNILPNNRREENGYIFSQRERDRAEGKR